MVLDYDNNISLLWCRLNGILFSVNRNGIIYRKEGYMPANVLIKDGDKYGGKYVATKSFKDNKVVCFGPDPKKVYDKAIKMGIDDPVVFFVPKKGMIHIY